VSKRAGRNGSSFRALRCSAWRSFYLDAEGSTWLGSTATGLHRVVDATITVHSETDAFSLKGAYSILEDRTGVIWLNNNGSLKRYSKGRWTEVSAFRTVEPDAIRSIYEDKAGRIWVGTSSAVGFIDGGKYKRYAEDSPFLNDWISAIVEDRSGAFWFAASSGLVRSPCTTTAGVSALMCPVTDARRCTAPAWRASGNERGFWAGGSTSNRALEPGPL